MSELFKALNEFKPTQPKKFHLEFVKEKIEVSLEKSFIKQMIGRLT